MNPRTLVRDLAGAKTAQHSFARNGVGLLYVSRAGVYRPGGEMLIRQRVKHSAPGLRLLGDVAVSFPRIGCYEEQLSPRPEHWPSSSVPSICVELGSFRKNTVSSFLISWVPVLIPISWYEQPGTD
jgi:hypothetical protein